MSALFLVGAGALLVGVFGWRIYHQYIAGGTMFFSGMYPFSYPLFLTFYYGPYALCVAAGLACLATSAFLLIYYRRLLHEPHS